MICFYENIRLLLLKIVVCFEFKKVTISLKADLAQSVMRSNPRIYRHSYLSLPLVPIYLKPSKIYMNSKSKSQRFD